MVLLQTLTPSGAATADFTAFDNATYTTYFITIAALVSASATKSMFWRHSTDGGSNFAASNAYFEHKSDNADTGSTVIENFSENQIKFSYVGGAAGTANPGAHSAQMWIHNAGNAASGTYVDFRSGVYRSGSTMGHMEGWGQVIAAEDTDACRILFSAGNITSGTLKLYGLK